MATNLAIDPELLDRAVEVSGERTKKAVVTNLTVLLIGISEYYKHIFMRRVSFDGRSSRI